MTVVLFLLGVLIFVVGLALSVGLHELGHLIPGKLFGVKVTQYFIGFGPTLWSRRRGETEYGVKAVPLGGYVKLVGMLPPADRSGSRPSKSRGIFSQLVDDARHAEHDETAGVPPERLFYRLPWWKKVIVMVSGVLTNLVLAFLLFAVVFMGHGVLTATTTVSGVSKCVVTVTRATAAQPPQCTASDPVAPARKAGMRPGDKIVSFNGTRVTSWEQIQTAIRHNGDHKATIVVRRDGHEKTLHASTTVTARSTDPADLKKLSKVGFLGISPTAVRERQGPGFVVDTMATATWETVNGIVSLPPKLYHVARASVGLEKRDQNGPMSVVGAGRIAGEGTAEASTLASGVFFVLSLLAGLNLFLGMLNLVPLLPLDGGQIAGALYEGARRGVARLRKRPDPGFVDIAKLLPVGYVMAGVILIASVVLIYADIVAPVTLS